MSALISDATIMAAIDALEISLENLTKELAIQGQDAEITNRITSIKTAIEELTDGLTGARQKGEDRGAGDLREEVATLREELTHLRQVVTSISFRLPHFAPPGVVTRRDGEDW
jgi:chromosome segregation ATPase